MNQAVQGAPPPGAPDLDDQALERLLREREAAEREQVLGAARALSDGSDCPVCGVAVAVRPTPWWLDAFVRRPTLVCGACGLETRPAPNGLGWLLGVALAVCLAVGGMSAIFSAQRIENPSWQKLTFLTGALLFASGLVLGYGTHNAGNDALLAQALVARRRRRADAALRGEDPNAEPVEDDAWFGENLEAVVVAIVLALIIRHFAMEAFVIPTGSMAPSLYGDHFDITCENCGYRFALGKEETEFYASPGHVVDGECPLCERDIHRDVTPRSVTGGHKILVNKAIYEVRPPARYEVIVFKFPQTPWKNFIKRLVGLPGERLEIRNGDLYADGVLARKPDSVQDGIWIPVFDSAFVPKDRADAAWAPIEDGSAAAWTLPDGTGHRIEVTPGAAPAWLAYQRPIYDVYGYNRGSYKPRRHRVADLRVRTHVTPESGATVRLAVVESADGGGERVVAAVLRCGADGAPGVALEVDGVEVARAEHSGLRAGAGVEVALAYADDQARVQVGGQTVLRWLDDAGPEATRTSNVRLSVDGARVLFDHVRIDRDVFYGASSGGRWDPARTPIDVPEDAFFCMGDNNPNSKDSRSWGFVRRGHLVGKAFMVFWPLVPWEVQLIR